MNGQNSASQLTHGTWLMLKITYGLVALIAGADKFFNIITYWAHYLSPMISNLFPVPATHILYAVGIVEMIVGILILSKFTRFGAYILAAWLVIIVANLLSMGMYYDIAVRDLVMAVGALALAQLTLIQERKL